MGVGEGSGCRTRARAKKDRKYIPAMPMPMAVICCILNFLAPGVGTILAGFCVCCCARNEDMSCCEQFCSSFMSILFGLLQLILAPLLLVGWVWSCFWGVSFIGMSKEYYHDNKPFDDTTQNTVVTNQPAPNTYGPGQWSTPGAGPSGPGPGYPSPGNQYPVQGHSQGYPQGGHPQGSYNPPVPSAPPAEPEYSQPGPGYIEPPPPYEIKDPYPQR